MLQVNVAKAKQFQLVIKYKGKPIAVKEYEQLVINSKHFRFFLPGMKILNVYDPQGTMHKISVKGSSFTATATNDTGSKTIFIRVKQGIFIWWQPLKLFMSPEYFIDSSLLNSIRLFDRGDTFKIEKLDLQNYFNDKVTNIFKHQYLSPRPAVPTLQLPTQGIGNWAYPLATANINDSGLSWSPS